MQLERYVIFVCEDGEAIGLKSGRAPLIFQPHVTALPVPLRVRLLQAVVL